MFPIRRSGNIEAKEAAGEASREMKSSAALKVARPAITLDQKGESCGQKGTISLVAADPRISLEEGEASFGKIGPEKRHWSGRERLTP